MLLRKVPLRLFLVILVTASTPLVFQSLFNASWVLAQTANERKAEADRLLKQGIGQLQTSQFEAALQSFQQALLIYREIKDLPWEGQALGNLGGTYLSLGNYPQAIEYAQQTLAIARAIKDRQSEGKALGILGLAYQNIGDYPKAIENHQQWLAIARAIKDRQSEGMALGNLGEDYRSLGNYTKAIEYSKQWLAIARAIKDRQSEGGALGNLGGTYLYLGDYTKAIEYSKQWLAIAKEIKDRRSEGKALGILGGAYLSLGDFAKAIEYYQQWLAIARAIKDRQSEGGALGNLGGAYLYLGDYTKAIKYYQQWLAIAKEIKDRQSEGKALSNLGNTSLYQGEYAKAIEYYQQHLAIARSIKDHQSEGDALGNLGVAYLSLGEYAKAIESHQQHLAIARSIKDRQGEGDALGNLGVAYLSLGEYAKAIESHQQNLAIARSIKDRQGEGSALNNLGLAFLKSGNLALAEKTLIKGIQVWESQRQRLGSNDANKVSIFEGQSRTYRTLQQVLIAQNKNNAALEIAERGRARAFVELLASKLSPKLQQQSPTSPTIEEIKQIAKAQNATIVEYSIIYDEFKVQGKPQANESELYIWVVKPTGEAKFHPVDLKPLLQRQNISLRDKVAQARGSIVKGVNVALRSGNNITLVPGDRIKLNDDAPDWEAWQVVSVDVKNGKITIRLPSWEPEKPAIERPIADVVKKIGINSSSANTKNPQLQELYQLLIQPIADILPKEETARVIFIPQDVLFLVPFPALQDPSGQYLIDKHTILTAPSFEVLDSTHKLRQKVPGSAKDVLVVGNPTMPKVSLKPGEPPKQLNPLPKAENEAKEIASKFQTQPLIGKQATKASILPLLPKARIIHLATHGLLDDFTGGDVPGAVALAPSGNDSGLLTASEILDLKLNAELVVLSACDTGQGRLTGDGVIGLSRSIIAAGVPSVIVSLWSIPDAPTASLMTEFYQNLQHQQDLATALRQAMLTTKIKHPNPAEWAAFTLIGESE
ncbi:CHAT domain-containing tetratricopeptide repeat protein [Dendronalium sp. ChiSLP03b]|uniref:CHAT domain-containing tetratricopeptide repeat protein n=1 Tax=Dendronalium sp. ChiSLP03b TaxID=3075381 RepID=UPI00391D7B66